MKRKEMLYEPFSKCIIRTPLYPIEFMFRLFGCAETPSEKMKEVCSNKVIQEAIFLASPVLYQELIKWLNNELTNPKEIEKLHISLAKYLIRMSTRCTPFGLFAGCSLGEFGDRTDVNFVEQKDYTNHTRLDMNYLCGLAQDLSRKTEIKYNIKYYPNTSIYMVGDEIRYVEYSYVNSRRVHHVIAVCETEYLNRIINASKKGAYIKDLVKLLIDDEITQEEAESFIDELINGQLLVSELEPAITGPEFLKQILKVLKNIENITELKQKLNLVNKILKEIANNPIGTSVSKYYQIKDVLNTMETGYDVKFLFQSDMNKPVNSSLISNQIVRDVWKAIEILNKFTPPVQESNITKFRDAFYERYEEAEIPLLKALDVESGIGYLQNNGKSNGDFTPLVDDIWLPVQSGTAQSIKWNRIQSILLKKYNQAITDGAYEIVFKEEDLVQLIIDESGWNDLPLTISAMVQLISNPNKKDDSVQIYLGAAGGSSSANLLGRFGHSDKKIHDYVMEITAKEQELLKDVIIAEIIHLPESRVGNILLRPVYRDYEIPYLAKSAVSMDKQIHLDDIMISVRRNRVILRSKKLNKEIIPRMSNAHNYSANALPIYHFLCDMQTQGLRGGVGFNWGALENECNFLPRVTYKNIILSRATWNIRKEEIETILKLKDGKKISKAIAEWRNKKKIPQYIVLVEGDNELTINLENIMCVKVFLSTVKRKTFFKLKEFLFDKENSFIRSGEDFFTNQIVFSFYKNKN